MMIDGRFSRFGHPLILTITILAVILGGSTESWQRGILAILAGLTWLAAPPHYSCGRLLNVLTCGFLLTATFAFLPLSWFGMPPWRQSLESDLGLPLPGTLSPQTWITLDAFLVLLTGLLWLLYVLSQRWGDEERLVFLKSLALIIAVIAGTAILSKLFAFDVKFWGSEQEDIGPFPNRNHFATLLAVGAVLSASCVYHEARRKHFKSTALFSFCLIICFAATVANGSRAGIVLLFAGLTIWMILISLGTRSFSRLGVSAALLILGAAAFFSFGGSLLDRFAGSSNIVARMSHEGRIPIYKDCLLLTSQNPLFGIGLGNFEGVFSLCQRHYHNPDRVIHPESDWIWILVELGLTGLVIAIWIILVITFRVGRLKPTRKTRRSRHRLRMGAFVAASLIPLHGIIDVPGHTASLTFLSVLLFSLAASQKSKLVPRRWPTRLYKIAAVPTIMLGIVANLSHFKNIAIPSNAGASQLYGWSVSLSSVPEGSREAFIFASMAARIKPLHWQYHFQRGRLSSQIGRSPQNARNDFRRARLLEQQSTWGVWAEAEHWLKYYPPYAIAPWREVLLRDPKRLNENYGRILKQARPFPELAKPVRALANLDLSLKLGFLSNLTGQEFNEELDTLLRIDPNLNQLNDAEQARLFRLWAKEGNTQQLIELLLRKPSWRQGGWKILAHYHAKLGELDKVMDLIDTHYVPPNPPEMRSRNPISQLAQDFSVNPQDVTKGLRLFFEQKRTLDIEAAAQTLSKIATLPNAPDYLGYLRYRLYRDVNDLKTAWQVFPNKN